MGWKLLLLFIALLLTINIEAKTLSPPESKTLEKFEDTETSHTVEDDEEEFYINIPTNVNLIKATLDIKGTNAKDIKIRIDNKILFENNTLYSTIENINLINNISTDNCEKICRWKLEVRVDEGKVTIKNLFINYTFTKTPLFIKYMDDVKFNGTKTDVFDLDDYFYGDVDKYKNRTSKAHSLDYIDIKIDSKNKVSFTVKQNWEGTGYLYFIADDDYDSAKSNIIKLIVGSGETKPFQFSPQNSTVIITENTQQIFGVSNTGNLKVDWYLNDKLAKTDSTTYVFDATATGTHYIEVKVGNTRRIWSVSVLEPEITTPEPIETEEIKEPICGNKIKEKNENCENCPEDVKCSPNSKCVNKKCILVEQKREFKGLILYLVIFALIIGLITTTIILIKKGKLKFPKIFKKKQKIIKEKEDLTPLRNYLTENLKKGHKKEDLIKAATEQGWKKEQIDKILTEQQPISTIKKEVLPKELEPLKNYIIDGIKKGYRKEDLIKATLKIGWTQKQIDEVLEKL